jgi:hypothetical protein
MNGYGSVLLIVLKRDRQAKTMLAKVAALSH